MVGDLDDALGLVQRAGRVANLRRNPTDSDDEDDEDALFVFSEEARQAVVVKSAELLSAFDAAEQGHRQFFRMAGSRRNLTVRHFSISSSPDFRC